MRAVRDRTRTGRCSEQRGLFGLVVLFGGGFARFLRVELRVAFAEDGARVGGHVGVGESVKIVSSIHQ